MLTRKNFIAAMRGEKVDKVPLLMREDSEYWWEPKEGRIQGGLDE